jgi:hypothetical protein
MSPCICSSAGPVHKSVQKAGPALPKCLRLPILPVHLVEASVMPATGESLRESHAGFWNGALRVARTAHSPSLRRLSSSLASSPRRFRSGRCSLRSVLGMRLPERAWHEGGCNSTNLRPDEQPR